MAATGARVSKLLHIKAGHVQAGYLDLYSKGGKIRRLYILKNLWIEATKWLKEKEVSSGYIFQNRFGERFTPRGIARQLKSLVYKYGMNREVAIPIHFGIVLPRISSNVSTTLLCLPTSWGMKASKPLASIFAGQLMNRQRLWMRLLIGDSVKNSLFIGKFK